MGQGDPCQDTPCRISELRLLCVYAPNCEEEHSTCNVALLPKHVDIVAARARTDGRQAALACGLGHAGRPVARVAGVLAGRGRGRGRAVGLPGREAPTPGLGGGLPDVASVHAGSPAARLGHSPPSNARELDGGVGTWRWAAARASRGRASCTAGMLPTPRESTPFQPHRADSGAARTSPGR